MSRQRLEPRNFLVIQGLNRDWGLAPDRVAEGFEVGCDAVSHLKTSAQCRDLARP